MSTILIAEDDKQIREALDRILRFEGYRTLPVNDGAAALEAFVEHEPDAVILDVNMPFVDGLSVTRKLRDRGDRTPILILTARQTTADRVEGLDAGADDYLPKPFELDELLARIRALLRRSGNGLVSPALIVDDLTVDTAKRLVTRAERTIELTKTEFDILELLARNADIVLSRSQIYEEIWGYDFESSSKSLDVHVGYLRRKLEDGGEPRVLHTVRGIGYVIRPPVGE
ncbi:MAG: response regulator transcription factor [Ilumatobacter sp.]|nr:response regulator transcription factor [Phycisphaera sp.]MDG1266218.1 response regulator transcription factor [Ilumatobacter sp.]MDG2234415.1 response regulator transcription factor [Ilumatobacter sp.]NKB41976.1 response regulator [Ilumatobacter sp.]